MRRRPVRYYCRDCDTVFSQMELAFEKHTELHTEVDTDRTEITFTGCCPDCGSSGYTTADYCILCSDEGDYNGNDLCPDCYRSLHYIMEGARSVIGREHRSIDDYEFMEVVQAYFRQEE